MKRRKSDKPSYKRQQVPFFARFLVKQELEEVSGQRNVTLKYPSDSDEPSPE